MNKVIIIENTLEPNNTVVFENVQDVRACIKEYFPTFPENTKIYLNEVCEENNVTPFDEASVEKLRELEGTFYVVVYPAGPIAVIAIIAVVAVVAAAFLLVPKIPNVASRVQNNSQNTSPNNELSDRSNRVRVNGRIPDIFGEVRSTPDLISVPYKIFEDNQEVEIAYMCLGKGYYEVDDIRDGDTLISDIAGATVEVYDPLTSPNSGSPSTIIGTPINEDVLKVSRLNDVNGQVLRAPNLQVNGESNIRFIFPNIIEAGGGSGINFTEFFLAGESLTLTNASYTGPTSSGTPPTLAVTLNGTYTITSVSSTQVVLTNPGAVNADWNNLNQYPSNATGYVSPKLAVSGNKWVGPFTADVTDLDRVFTNFVALNGIYKDNGTQQQKFDVTVEVELTPVDASGTPTGSAETFQTTLEGSSVTKETRAKTLKIDPTFTGRCKVRARRVTNADHDYSGTVVDDIKWRDVYAISPVTQSHFGDVTTIHSKTYATSGALNVKDRKLNLLASRKIKTRISGTTFTSTLSATKNAAEIFMHICQDPYIGNRAMSEIDVDSVYNTLATVLSYFGDASSTEFSYTFDNDNLSFEETAASIANAVFCTAYRQGSQIKWLEEIATEDSSLIFNHRNKIPGSETRTIRFGNQSENDGVELEYVDPEDDAITTFYIPTDRSAYNARRIETIGIRNSKQAIWAAYRAWNKIKYQNTLTEFDCTAEGALTILKQRILVADNTRPDTQDGEVVAQSGLELTLSQPVEFEIGKNYLIFLQHTDGTTQSIAITAGSTNRKVILGYAPSASLALDSNLYAKTTYIIVKEDNPRTQAFLLTDKNAKDNFNFQLTAANYSSLYYQVDELQFWLNFKDQTYNDFSAFERHGIKIGSGSIVNDAQRGYVYQGVSSGDRITLPVSFNAPASYTKSAWVYSTGNASYKNIISDAVGGREVFYLSTSGQVEAGHNGAWFGVCNAALPSLNNWHHVAVTYDATSLVMKLYINGVLVDTATSVAQRTLGNVQVGSYAAGVDSFINGKLDEVRLYKRALSNDEIREIYRSTS